MFVSVMFLFFFSLTTEKVFAANMLNFYNWAFFLYLKEDVFLCLDISEGKHK